MGEVKGPLLIFPGDILRRHVTDICREEHGNSLDKTNIEAANLFEQPGRPILIRGMKLFTLERPVVFYQLGPCIMQVGLGGRPLHR